MDQLKTLLWLKWRLTVRAYERSPSRLLGLILVALIMGVMSVVIAGACLAGFVNLPEPTAAELLHVLLLGLWCFWLFAPVLGFSLNEAYDITKQLVFPIPRMRMFIASILSSLIALPIIFLLPLAAAVILGFSSRHMGQLVTILAVPLTALVLALFALHMLSLSQVLLTMLLGVLRSRRYQDILTVVMPLVLAAVVLAPHFLARAAQRDAITFDAILAARPSRYLMYAPSGLAAEAIEAVSYGEYLPFAVFTGSLALVTAAVFWLGSHVMQRVYEGDIIDSRRTSRPPTAADSTGGAARASPWLRLVPAPLLTMALKELRYLRRDPQMVSALLGMAATPIFWLLLYVLMGRPWQLSGPLIPAAVGGLVVYGGAPLVMNIFGYDREGLNILFLFPSDRRLLLVGKNIFGLVILVGASSIVLAAVAAWMKEPGAVAATLPFLVGISFVAVAGGNVASVYFPVRVGARGESPFSRSAEKGCMHQLVRGLVMQGVLLASLPIAAGFLAPHFLRTPALYAVIGPVSIAYGAALYALVLPYAAAALLQRETQLIEICTATEEL